MNLHLPVQIDFSPLICFDRDRLKSEMGGIVGTRLHIRPAGFYSIKKGISEEFSFNEGVEPESPFVEIHIGVDTSTLLQFNETAPVWLMAIHGSCRFGKESECVVMCAEKRSGFDKTVDLILW